MFIFSDSAVSEDGTPVVDQENKTQDSAVSEDETTPVTVPPTTETSLSGEKSEKDEEMETKGGADKGEVDGEEEEEELGAEEEEQEENTSVNELQEVCGQM